MTKLANPNNNELDRDNSLRSIRFRVLSPQNLVGLLIVAIFLIFASTRLDMDWPDTWNRIKTSNTKLYILGVITYYSGFYLRGLRWHVMLKSAGKPDATPGSIPKASALGQYVLLGWFINSITWFRLGDLYRSYIVSQRSYLSFSLTMGTVLSERIVDIVTVFLLLLVASIILYESHRFEGLGLFLCIAFGLTILATLAILIMKQLGVRFAQILPRRLQAAYWIFVNSAIGSLKQLPLLLILSLLIWFTEIGRLTFVIQSLNIDTNLSLSVVIFVTLAASILTAIPLTPGGLGVVEPGILGLLIISLPRSEALSIVLLDRSISYLSILFVGGLLFLLYQTKRAK
jgi:uncharacterized protein (TIRG00374 family)